MERVCALLLLLFFLFFYFFYYFILCIIIIIIIIIIARCAESALWTKLASGCVSIQSAFKRMLNSGIVSIADQKC